MSRRAAVEALMRRALLLDGQIAALDADIHALAGEYRLPRLALVEEEWKRAQRQAERDFTLQLVAALRDGSITWDEVDSFEPPRLVSLPPATGGDERVTTNQRRDHQPTTKSNSAAYDR